MKLKKIASLMLAGVMAVSMLAGCKSGSGSATTPDDDGTVVVPETGIAAAFNNGQSKNNDAEVKFTEDSDLAAKLALVVKDLGEKFDESDVAERLAGYTGLTVGSTTANSFYDKGAVSELCSNLTANGIVAKDKKADDKIAPKTYVYGYVVKSNNAWTEENAVKVAVNAADEAIAKLAANTLDAQWEDNLNIDEKYYSYSYTGDVAMVTETNGDGTTSYYFAFVVTQNVTLVTYEG